MGTDRNKLKRQAAKVKGESVKLKKNEVKAKKATPMPPPPDHLSASEFEWHVELAAKGMAERDRFPMPKSVTTPEAFYEVMAGAALEATGLRALLERAARAERELELIQDALRQSDAKAEVARHRMGIAEGAEPNAPAAPQAGTIRPSIPMPSAPSHAETVSPAPPKSPAADPRASGHRPAERTARWPIAGLLAARRAFVAAVQRVSSWNDRAWSWCKRIVLRRPERLTCSQCGARHPVIYGGDPCVICDTELPQRRLSPAM